MNSKLHASYIKQAQHLKQGQHYHKHSDCRSSKQRTSIQIFKYSVSGTTTGTSIDLTLPKYLPSRSLEDLKRCFSLFPINGFFSLLNPIARLSHQCNSPDRAPINSPLLQRQRLQVPTAPMVPLRHDFPAQFPAHRPHLLRYRRHRPPQQHNGVGRRRLPLPGPTAAA